jgi:hypothetical protein
MRPSEESDLFDVDLSWLTDPENISKAGISGEQAYFTLRGVKELLKRLSSSNVLQTPESPTYWILEDKNGRGLRKLFQFCLEVEITKHIKNYEQVFNRLVTPGEFFGAKSEIRAGAWAKVAGNDVEYMIQESRIGKRNDLKLTNFWGDAEVEVKSKETSDFEIAVGIFKQNVEKELAGLNHDRRSTITVRFGEYWLSSLAVACSVRASKDTWATREVIRVLAVEAARDVREFLARDTTSGATRPPRDIELTTCILDYEPERSLVVELSPALRVSILNPIVRELTHKDNIKKIALGPVVYLFCTQGLVDERMAKTIISAMMLKVLDWDSELKQPVDLLENLRGVYIISYEDDSFLAIENPSKYFEGKEDEIERNARRFETCFAPPKWMDISCV